LSNHLGNVLATVSDKKIGVDVAPADGIIDYYTADVVTANDYFPFGSQMPGRKYSRANSSYRYGFNGQEKDTEIGVDKLDFGERIYDSRLGRFLSLDPYIKNTPSISPYLFANNSPIINIDYKGGFAIFWHYIITKRALLKLGVSKNVAKLISHYASVFADNPKKSEGWLTSPILKFNQGRAISRGVEIVEARKYIGQFRDDVSYQATENTQSMTDRTANIQHATRMASEVGSVSAEMRVLDSKQFAWDKIYESASLGSIETFKAKDKGLEALGMGIHALEDIERHKGAVYAKGKANQHNLKKDVWPDAGEVDKAEASVTNALIVHQVLNGNFKNAGVGTKIDIDGMNGAQLDKLKNAVNKGGYEFKQKESHSTEYSIQKKG